jgi:Tfp pilus assembly protein PilF
MMSIDTQSSGSAWPRAAQKTATFRSLRLIAQDQARLKADSLDAAAAYRNLGAIAGLRDPKRAREAYGRAVALDPDDREALYWHAWLQLLAGDLGLADRDLKRLLQVSVAAHRRILLTFELVAMSDGKR